MEPSNSAKSDSKLQFATTAVHAGYSSDICRDRPVVEPIILSSCYEFETVEMSGYYYARCGNRNRSNLEKSIAALEEAEYGLCYSSGMAAIFSVMYLLNPGDHIICSHLLYGGTMKMLKNYTSQKGVDISYLDLTNIERLKKEMRGNTKMIYTECCCNPILTVVDLEAISEVAKQKPGVLIVIDNTFITPYFQKPLNQGADVVLHSATKYLNGHGDVVLGVLVTRHSSLYEKLKDIQSSLGFVPSPFDCYLVSRGLRTLHLRMKEHMRNAIAVAKYLESHPLVKKVLYPGLPSHPQYVLAKKQFSGFGGVLGFYIDGGRAEVEKFMGALKIITVTGSLGQPNSLISFPATVSHSYVEEEERKILGVTDDYIRFAVGLEDSDDLIRDLEQAFQKLAK